MKKSNPIQLTVSTQGMAFSNTDTGKSFIVWTQFKIKKDDPVIIEMALLLEVEAIDIIEAAKTFLKFVSDLPDLK
jgi:hypothetical protein